MDIMQFLGGLKGDILKSRLLAMGIEPHRLEGVDFNNLDQLNQLAEQIMPGLIKSNPNVANLIKQNSAALGADKQADVVKVIDSM